MIKNATFKIYFNRLGKAVRVVQYASSGDKARDKLCMQYCLGMVVEPPRLGSRRMGELWRKVVIEPGANISLDSL